MKTEALLQEIERRRKELWYIRKKEIESRVIKKKRNYIYQHKSVTLFLLFLVASPFYYSLFTNNYAFIATLLSLFVLATAIEVKGFRAKNSDIYLDQWEESIISSLIKYKSKDELAKNILIKKLISKKYFREEKVQLFMIWRKRERRQLLESKKMVQDLIRDFSKE